MEFVRARTKEQKDLRMQDIMRAADALFSEQTFHGISLTTIAERLGWSRGNLYKYVTTKEEIFLELYKEKHFAWIDAVNLAFPERVNMPVDAFVRTWSRVLGDHVDFLKYQNILALVVETNIPIAMLADFKKHLWDERQPLLDVMHVQFPSMQERELRKLLLTLIYQASGLYNHHYLTPNLREALKLAEISISSSDFATDFEGFLTTYLKGLASEIS